MTSTEYKSAYQQGYSDAMCDFRKEPKTDVLDKIRAEIEQDAFKDVDGSKFIFVNRINQIIDKYKAESAHDVAQEIVKNNGVVDL